MNKFRYLVTMVLLHFCNVSAQNYCSTFGAFLSPSYPASIAVSVINVDTVLTFYGEQFYTKLKIARPINDILPFIKRPLIIGVHGGGFISDSIGMSATNGYLSMFNNMNSAAQFGYIGASLDYRTGYGVLDENITLAALTAPGFPACNAVTSTIMDKIDNAAYRATFDCLKAIDFVCKNSTLFPNIDTNQIYLYGSSAGAIVVLNAILSELNEFESLPLSEQLPFPKRHKIAGVISLSGAINQSTANKLQTAGLNSYTTPLFLAHGNNDTVVSNTIAPLGNCTNLSTNYNWNGSSKISNIACSINIPHQLFLIDSSGHDLGSASPVSNTLITSSFTYFYNVGICPSFPESIQKLYNLNGDNLSNTFCTMAGTIETQFNNMNFVVYPNPATVALNVMISNDEITEISILNMDGRILKKKDFVASTSSTQQTINIEDLSSGMYFLVIKQGNKMGQKVFVKM